MLGLSPVTFVTMSFEKVLAVALTAVPATYVPVIVAGCDVRPSAGVGTAENSATLPDRTFSVNVGALADEVYCISAVMRYAMPRTIVFAGIVYVVANCVSAPCAPWAAQVPTGGVLPVVAHRTSVAIVVGVPTLQVPSFLNEPEQEPEAQSVATFADVARTAFPLLPVSTAAVANAGVVEQFPAEFNRPEHVPELNSATTSLAAAATALPPLPLSTEEPVTVVVLLIKFTG